MKNIQLKVFGRFKKYIPKGEILIPVDNVETVGELKQQIHRYLIKNIPSYNEETLVFESALATEVDILNDDDQMISDNHYTILPPVCGG